MWEAETRFVLIVSWIMVDPEFTDHISDTPFDNEFIEKCGPIGNMIWIICKDKSASFYIKENGMWYKKTGFYL